MSLGDTLEMAMSEHLRLVHDLNKARTFLSMLQGLNADDKEAVIHMKGKALELMQELDFHLAKTQKQISDSLGGEPR